MQAFLQDLDPCGVCDSELQLLHLENEDMRQTELPSQLHSRCSAHDAGKWERGPAISAAPNGVRIWGAQEIAP